MKHQLSTSCGKVTGVQTYLHKTQDHSVFFLSGFIFRFHYILSSNLGGQDGCHLSSSDHALIILSCSIFNNKQKKKKNGDTRAFERVWVSRLQQMVLNVHFISHTKSNYCEIQFSAGKLFSRGLNATLFSNPFLPPIHPPTERGKFLEREREGKFLEREREREEYWERERRRRNRQSRQTDESSWASFHPIVCTIIICHISVHTKIVLCMTSSLSFSLSPRCGSSSPLCPRSHTPVRIYTRLRDPYGDLSVVNQVFTLILIRDRERERYICMHMERWIWICIYMVDALLEGIWNMLNFVSLLLFCLLTSQGFQICIDVNFCVN